jgi:K+-transporting ATPase c subunit
MLQLFFLLVATQVVPCTPSDSTVVCQCKQGRASACEILRQTSPQLAEAIDRAVQAMKAAEEAQQQAEQAAKSEAVAASGSSEPPNCRGQQHHVISRPIAEALKDHETLRGFYSPGIPAS